MRASDRRSRSWLVALSLVTLAAPLAGQNPSSIPSTSGGWVSRFVSADVLLRMRERLEHVEPLETPAPLDSVWSALRPALEGLGVKVAFADPASRQMGTAQVKIFRRLGKESLSSYLRCGDGIAGPNADTYAVYLSLVSFLAPGSTPGSTRLYTLIAAQAEDVANGRNDLIPCTSTGMLERRIGRAVVAAVSRD